MTPATSVDPKKKKELFQFSLRNLEALWHDSKGTNGLKAIQAAPSNAMAPNSHGRAPKYVCAPGRFSRVRVSRPEVDAWLR